MSEKPEDRRRYRVFVTEGLEFHMRDETCIAVKQKGGDWQQSHPAVGTRLSDMTAREVKVGDRLKFGDAQTAPVTSIERPAHWKPNG